MRVLLCVDDDPVLGAVVAAAEQLVATSKWDELIVFHVVPTAPLSLIHRGQATPPSADAFMSTVAGQLSHLPATVETMLAGGDAAEAIVRAADDHDVDLIVIGARGEHREFPVGSVSQKVVALADADVLAVRECETEPGFRALIAVDGSQGSDAAITSFSNKLQAQRAQIHVVHVIESLPLLWEVGSHLESVAAPLVRHAESLLSHARSLLAARGLDAECEWLHGPPASRILELARSRRCSLIVVGSHGHARLAELLLAPLTQRILRYAPCSVLCARGWSPEWAALTSEWFPENAEPSAGLA